MHANAELLDDVIKFAILFLSGAGALYSRRAHSVAKRVDHAVNGVTDPNEKTLRENVKDLHDEMTDSRNGG